MQKNEIDSKLESVKYERICCITVPGWQKFVQQALRDAVTVDFVE